VRPNWQLSLLKWIQRAYSFPLPTTNKEGGITVIYVLYLPDEEYYEYKTRKDAEKQISYLIDEGCMASDIVVIEGQILFFELERTTKVSLGE
jgi:hypothetical protein